MSVCDPSLRSPLRPSFTPKPNSPESPTIQAIIETLRLQKHLEGGYFVETDRDQLRVPNPFQTPPNPFPNGEADDPTRSASTTIYYLITPSNPLGIFHRNKGRTVHTLHKGRGRYVIIHADEVQRGQKARIETFVVGQDIASGERLQWIVEGGKYKSSFLLPDKHGTGGSDGLLISETVVPGFEFSDHDFMPAATLTELASPEQEKELRWMLSLES
ncbi:hypothetical protein MMC27_002045 [Xylographa pallens]|nr:hypothetical protein [Xylographa pallens]